MIQPFSFSDKAVQLLFNRLADCGTKLNLPVYSQFAPMLYDLNCIKAVSRKNILIGSKKL